MDAGNNSRKILLSAAGNRNAAIVQLLIDMGKADLDTKDTEGRMPLLWAAGNGHPAVAKLLVERSKVGLDTKDSKARAPLF